jgi:hypothetical protein
MTLLSFRNIEVGASIKNGSAILKWRLTISHVEQPFNLRKEALLEKRAFDRGSGPFLGKQELPHR